MTEEFGIPVVHLLKGVLYNHQELSWRLLIQNQPKVMDYVGKIGLDLFINEAEGYAFLKQKETDPEDASSIDFPKVMQKRPLSYSLTLMCVLLRKKLLEFDLSGNESRLVLSLDEIIEMVAIFRSLPGSNEKKLVDEIKRDIKRLIEYGFLVPLKNEADKFEVNKILKAYIEIEKLNEILQRLKGFGDNIAEKGDEELTYDDNE